MLEWTKVYTGELINLWDDSKMIMARQAKLINLSNLSYFSILLLCNVDWEGVSYILGGCNLENCRNLWLRKLNKPKYNLLTF